MTKGACGGELELPERKAPPSTAKLEWSRKQESKRVTRAGVVVISAR